MSSSSTVTRYHALFESLRSRRRRPENPKGLDVFASLARMKLRTRGVTLSWLRTEAEAVNALAPDIRTHSEAALNEIIRESRDLFIRGRQNAQAVRRAFAIVREVARRDTGEEAYIVQLMGAMALYHGRIVEMVTGEGKTLTGSLAAPLLAWQHRYLHIYTVNDYLAQRDAESRAGIYRRMGCDVGAIVQTMDEHQRFDVYAKPIVYGTPKQITADWLRDQLRLGQLATPWAGRRLLSGVGGTGPMIPGLRAALVDEADAVLIDEGVVPLIIARSRREDEMSTVYKDATWIAKKLDEKADYTMDHLRRKAELTRRGRHRLEEMAGGLEEPIWRAVRRAEELVRMAIVARHCYLAGHQYQIVDGRIVIVDEYTGRFLPDRSWEHGLHQSVEAKENLEITADRETLARMSFQRFFRSYPFLCGMTGTIADAAVEMEKIYQPPHHHRSHQPPAHPRALAHARLPHPGSQVERDRGEHPAPARPAPAAAGGHALHRGQRVPGPAAHGPRAAPPRAQRQLRQRRGRLGRDGRQARRNHRRHEHGRSRHGHQARSREPRARRAARHPHRDAHGPAHRPAVRRARGAPGRPGQRPDVRELAGRDHQALHAQARHACRGLQRPGRRRAHRHRPAAEPTFSSGSPSCAPKPAPASAAPMCSGRTTGSRRICRGSRRSQAGTPTLRAGLCLPSRFFRYTRTVPEPARPPTFLDHLERLLLRAILGGSGRSCGSSSASRRGTRTTRRPRSA